MVNIILTAEDVGHLLAMIIRFWVSQVSALGNGRGRTMEIMTATGSPQDLSSGLQN